MRTLSEQRIYITEHGKEKMNYYGKKINRILSAYRYKDIPLLLKARFFFFMCLIIIALLPVMLLYTVHLHLNNPEYNHEIQYYILIPQIVAFIFVIMTAFILVKGYFKAAVHLLLITLFAAIWLVMFADQAHVVSRLDTIVLAIALMALIPLASSKTGNAPFIYGILNIAALYSYMAYFRLDLNIPYSSYFDYLADNTMAFIFTTVLSYSIIKINNTSLDIAEKFNIDLKKSNEELEAVNEELLAAIEELEATNEEFEAQNRELIESQNRLLQAQKMEAIGTLAGGIAHDFNNLLSGIKGSLNLISHFIDSKDDADREEIKNCIDIALRASGRAGDITRQLLTLSKKTDPLKTVMDITASVKDIEKICKSSFPKSVDLNFSLPEEKIFILGDPSQIEQMILNLCLNASQAMTVMRPEGEKQGGEIYVTVSTVIPDKESSFNPESPLPCVKITVKDTGIGIDEYTREHIFEPFFSMKGDHEGTGLGLAMVYAIINQHNGTIHLDSSPGKGSTFTIHIPLAEDYELLLRTPEPEGTLSKGEGQILVVDDEKTVLSISEKILRYCGYRVVTAESGNSALEIFKNEYLKISLVLLDFSMPGMSGIDVFSSMKDIDPSVKVLLVSGFIENEVMAKAREKGIEHFLHKPFSASELSQKVYEILKKTDNEDYQS